MALSVQSYNPGTISGVTSGTNRRISGVTQTNPGNISGVSYATPPRISGVVSNYGMQQSPWYTSPIQLRGPGQTQPTRTSPYVDNGYAALEARYNRLESLLNPVYAPNLDISSVNARARQQAESSVNPLYTRRLNDLLARKTVEKKRAETDRVLADQQAARDLQLTQESNALERQRTGEDVNTAMQGINTEMDRFQTDTGQQFDAQRIAQARELATSGLTGSGVGQQQVLQAQQQQNITENRQEEDAQRQRNAQALLKARTFEDLAKSDVLAYERKDTKAKQNKLDLDRIIEDIDYGLQQEKFSLEQQRYSDVATQTKQYGQTFVNNFIASITDPRLREAAVRTYGGLFA